MARTNILRITQIKSGIGYNSKAKATLKALRLEEKCIKVLNCRVILQL